MTHVLTYEQKKRGGNNGEKRIHGCGNPAANQLYFLEIPRKTSLSNLHTHEATGSNPVVSTKNHRNRLIPVILFYNLQLFMALNFCCFFKTHTLTHTGKCWKVPDRARQDFSCPALFFYRICWLMTPPMVSAASCFIWAVAWV